MNIASRNIFFSLSLSTRCRVRDFNVNTRCVIWFIHGAYTISFTPTIRYGFRIAGIRIHSHVWSPRYDSKISCVSQSVLSFSLCTKKVDTCIKRMNLRWAHSHPQFWKFIHRVVSILNCLFGWLLLVLLLLLLLLPFDFVPIFSSLRTLALIIFWCAECERSARAYKRRAEHTLKSSPSNVRDRAREQNKIYYTHIAWYRFGWVRMFQWRCFQFSISIVFSL